MLKEFFEKNIVFVLLSFLFAALLNLSQEPYSVGIFRWIAFIPLFYILFSDKLNLKRKIFFSWLSVFLFVLFNGTAILDIHPLYWIGINNYFVSLLLVFSLLIFYALILSLPSALFPVFLKYLPGYLFPLIWVLQEYSRSFLFSLISLGESSSLGSFFTLGFIGYGISSNNFLLNMIPLNVYLWGIIIVFVNYFLFISINKIKNRKRIILFSIFALIILTEFLPSIEPVQEIGINVGSIQAENKIQFYYSSKYFEDTSTIFTNKINALLEEHPETDLIVLPESSNFIEKATRTLNIPKDEFISNLLGNDSYRVVFYGNYNTTTKKSLMSAFSNNKEENLHSVEKNYLMVLGEYQPYIYKFILDAFNKKDIKNKLELFRNSNEGKINQSRVIKTEIGNIAPVSCSEILSPETYKRVKVFEPTLIIHQQRLAPFHKNTKAFYQIIEMSKFHAAVLNKYIIGSVDGGGYSYIINPKGEVVKIGKPGDDFIYASI